MANHFETIKLYPEVGQILNTQIKARFSNQKSPAQMIFDWKILEAPTNGCTVLELSNFIIDKIAKVVVWGASKKIKFTKLKMKLNDG